jgi:O-antigen ligase
MTFSAVVIAVGFIVPFLIPVHTFPIPSFYSEWTALWIGTLALVPLVFQICVNTRSISYSGHCILIIPAVCKYLFAAALWTLMQCYLMGEVVYPELYMIQTLYLLWILMLIVLVISSQLKLPEWVLIISSSICLGGLIQSAVAIIQFFHIHTAVDFAISSVGSGQTQVHNVFGNIAQLNHFADYLFLSLISTIYLWSRKCIRDLIAIVLIATLCFSLLLSGSKSLVVYWLILFISLLSFQIQSKRLYVVLVVTILCQIGLMVTHTIDGLSTLSNRIEDEVGAATVSGVSIRIYLWKQAFHMWIQHPLMGVGIGSYAGNFFNNLLDFPDIHIPGYDKYAHNIFIQILTESGLVGFCLFIGGIIAWLKENTLQRDIDSWWILCCLAVITFHACVEYPLEYGNFLLIYSSLLGLSLKARNV